jgi:oligopeptide transport system substrate-binding protein
MLVDEYAVIAPIYFYTRNTVSKPYIIRTFGTGGQEALEKWDVAQ